MFFFIDLDARPWDFQAEECSLRACVDRFNNRRYTNLGKVRLILGRIDYQQISTIL